MVFQFVENIPPFTSFFELINRVPTKPALMSVALIAFIFLFYNLSKKPSFPDIFPRFIEKFEENDLNIDTKIAMARFTWFERRGLQPKDINNLFITLVFIGIGVAFMTQTVYFAVIPTQSMVPTLMPSDLVFVEAISLSKIEVGDIVVFTPPGSSYVTAWDARNDVSAVSNYVHRVISISEDGRIQTAGDNGKVPDPFTITQKNIVGKVAEFNGKPVVFRGKGIYFMPGRVTLQRFAGDPIFRWTQSGIGLIQEYGPIYLVALLLLAFIELGRSASRSGA